MSLGDDLALINQTLSRYIDGVNKRDPKIWGEAWDSDGRWLFIGSDPIEGRANIVTAWTRAMADYPFVVMHGTQGSVIVEDIHATGTSYTFEVAKTSNGKALRIWGQYDDTYRKRDGVWRFSSRAFTILKIEEYEE